MKPALTITTDSNGGLYLTNTTINDYRYNSDPAPSKCLIELIRKDTQRIHAIVRSDVGNDSQRKQTSWAIDAERVKVVGTTSMPRSRLKRSMVPKFKISLSKNSGMRSSFVWK